MFTVWTPTLSNFKLSPKKANGQITRSSAIAVIADRTACSSTIG